MRRKVIQIANSTHLISLPRKWSIRNKINKGDELEITENTRSLTISCEPNPEENKAIINVTDLDYASIMFNIRAAYRRGYDEIEIIFDKPTTPYYRTQQNLRVSSAIHTEVNRLVGVEIIKEDNKRCMIKDIQTTSQKDFETILKRIFELIIQSMNDLYEGASKSDQAILNSIEEKHDTTTKFVSYCLRTLNRSGHPDPKNIAVLYQVISNLDIMIDIIKYASRDIVKLNKKLSRDAIKFMEKINSTLVMMQEVFYKYNKKTVSKISKERDMMSELVHSESGKISHDELLIVNNMLQISEMIRDTIAAKMSLEIDA